MTAFEAFGKTRVTVEFEASSLKRVVRGPAAGDDLSITLEQHHFGTMPVVEAATYQISAVPSPPEMLAQRQPLVLIARPDALPVNLVRRAQQALEHQATHHLPVF